MAPISRSALARMNGSSMAMRRLENPFVVCTRMRPWSGGSLFDITGSGWKPSERTARAAGQTGNTGSCTMRPENVSWSLNTASTSSMRDTTHMSSVGA